MNPLPEPPALHPPPGGGAVQGYYRLHARIYDATRWTFLFGRDTVLDLAASAQPAPAQILEIGCGTGRNLAALARRFPRARLTGVDLSADMLAIAGRKTAAFGDRVQLLPRAYGPWLDAPGTYDLVLCSYSLSMFNPGFEEAIAAAVRDLAPGGCLAVVDFHASRHKFFNRWMGANHVRMDGQLLPLLRDQLQPVTDELWTAYWGAWEYLLFVGRRPA